MFSILQALAQQAEVPAFNTEVALAIERLEGNAELLSSVREALRRDASRLE